jgi:hypothetical protein
METRRLLKKNIRENPSFSAGKLKRCTPVLENLSIRTIKKCCLTDMQLSSRRKAKKPPHSVHEGAEARVC